VFGGGRYEVIMNFSLVLAKNSPRHNHRGFCGLSFLMGFILTNYLEKIFTLKAV